MDKGTKDQKEAEKAARKLLFGKYESEEEAEKGFNELQKKFGAQSDELGVMKKQLEQYAAYLNQVKPVMDWYTQNYQALQTGTYGRGAQTQPQAQPSAQAQAQATQALNQTGSLNWLTPDEQKSLVNLVATQIQSGALEPWQKNFAAQVQDFATKQSKAIEDSLLTHQKSFADVMWRTLERILPEDKVKEAREWHTEALRFADPRNIDPMAVANDVLTMKSKASQYEKENTELKTKLAEREKQDAGFMSGTKPFSLTSTVPAEDARAKTREDRYAYAMNAVKEQHGSDGVASLFGNRG